MRRRRLGALPHVLVDGRDGERHRDRRALGRLDEHVEVADDHRPARDDRQRVRRVAQHLEARACQLVAAFGRLVGIGCGADRDMLVLPGGARELPAQDLRDVGLDADRGPVTVVGRPVGAMLEVPHVAERAPVHAAHVRIERPLEAHALDRIQGALAGLFAILDAHDLSGEYRTSVRIA